MTAHQSPPGDGGTTNRAAVLDPVAPRPRHVSFFGVVPAGSVRRRPSDAVQLAVAVVLLASAYIATDGFSASDHRFYRTISDLPAWINSGGTGLYVATTIGATVVVIGGLLVTRNLRLSLTLLALAMATLLVTAGLTAVIDIDAIRRSSGFLSTTSVAWLAVGLAVLRAVEPYVVLPMRRAVRLVEVVALVGAGLAAVGSLAVILGALGVAWGMSALLSLAVGTPKATPTPEMVAEALADLGVSIGDLRLAERQPWGESHFVGTAPDGAPASVVVIGRDAGDARLVAKVWRSVVFRDAGPSISVTRSSQLEHRAYLLLMAARAGVRVSDVVVAALGGPEATAVLVLLDPPGRPLSAVPPEDVDDATVDAAWATLGRLHDARLVHGDLGPDHVLRADDGTIAFVDLSRGSTGATPERIRRDQVDLLVTTAVLVGDDRALAAALRHLGPDPLGELLPLLEPAALSPSAHRAVPDRRKRLKALREAGAALTGQEVPKLTELRRVSPSSVLMAAGTFLGFYLIVAQFAGVDLWSSVSQAEVGWVLVTFALSFVPQFSGAVALQGAVGAPLPYGPVVAEQFANNFTGLIGGTLATTALVIRFFQKQGLKVAVAASSGVMNALASSVVEFVLIAVGLLFSSTEFVPSSAGGSGDARLIVVGILVAGVAITIALLVPKVRALLKRTVGPQVAAAKENLGAILSQPRKALMMFGGNLVSQVAFALVISAALRAYGTSLPLLDIIVINSLASLLGGLAPVPGGMGVVEAGLIAGMTAVGVDQTVAVSATFTARLFTSYLPPIWGWFSLQWLRRHDYV